jgi:carboxylesterase
MNRRTFAAGLASSLMGGALVGCRGANGAPTAAPSQQPPASYAAALQRALDIIGRDAANPAVERQGLPRVYVHGKAVEHAVILFHGFTNCPEQFDELARQYYERGCNVFVPRLPRHGLSDRLTNDLANLTIAELVECADEAYWLGRGLGRSVSAVGLSLGGAMAMWLAQTRPIDLAVPVSPFFSPIGYSEFEGTLIAHALYTIPSMYWWWDPRIKERCLPLYAYPGYPTHGLSEIIFFAANVLALAATEKPQARACTLIVNSGDNAVNNSVQQGLIAQWNRGGANYGTYVFSNLGPPRHDIIDPTTYPQGRTLVYPTLERLVLGSVR